MCIEFQFKAGVQGDKLYWIACRHLIFMFKIVLYLKYQVGAKKYHPGQFANTPDIFGTKLNHQKHGSLNLITFIFDTTFSDSLSILGLWVLGLADTHKNESNSKLMSPEHYFS